MARDWNEREHPRNPEDGQFVDKVGGGGWARRLSDMIGLGRHRSSGPTPRPEPDYPKIAKGDPSGRGGDRDYSLEHSPETRAAHRQYAEDIAFGHGLHATDSRASRAESLRHMARYNAGVYHPEDRDYMNQLADDLSNPGVRDATSPASRARPAPEAPDPVQERREAVLEALNPEAAFRRKAEPLLREIYAPHPEYGDPGISDQRVEEYIRESIPRTAPITDENLDDMLVNILSLEDEAGFQAMDDGLTRIPNWESRFPGTYERISDFFDEEDY